MKIKAVLFDFMGTVVKERENGVITCCLADAFVEHGFYLHHEVFSAERGKDELTVINDVLGWYSLPRAMAPKLYQSFEKNIQKNIEAFCAFDESLFTFSYLLRVGISVGIVTGLSKEVFDFIFSHLGWTQRSFSYIGFSAEIGKSRPEPDMIFDMMSKLNIKDPKEVLKVGDSVADVQEGRNAGCLTAVVLSGTHSLRELMKEKPDYILRSLSDIKGIINVSKKYDLNTSKNRLV